MLERRQAFCYAGGPLEETGVQIIRRFITSKLAGQAWNAEHLLDDKDAAKFIFRRIDDVAVAADVKAIGGFEGQAAAMYWKAWAGVTPVWRKPTPIKPHWVTYPGRKSLNYDDESNRNATDPVNALLNWGYKIAETEAVLACRNVALSPTMGISHLDLKSHRRRNAFALDLMECMRPAVDEIVLDAIGETMDKRLFAESPQGVVTIEAPLTHAVAARVHTVAYKLVPDVKYALDTLHG
jgi:CRISPR-associated protein Cas1